jgi:hypothetical protein
MGSSPVAVVARVSHRSQMTCKQKLEKPFERKRPVPDSAEFSNPRVSFSAGH